MVIEVYHLALGSCELLFSPSAMLEVVKGQLGNGRDYPAGKMHAVCNPSIGELMQFLDTHVCEVEEVVVLGVVRLEEKRMPHVIGSPCVKCTEYALQAASENNLLFFVKEESELPIGHLANRQLEEVVTDDGEIVWR